MWKVRSVRMATAPQSSTMRLKWGSVCCSRVGSGGQTGTATIRANRHPHIALTNSSPAHNSCPLVSLLVRTRLHVQDRRLLVAPAWEPLPVHDTKTMSCSCSCGLQIEGSRYRLQGRCDLRKVDLHMNETAYRPSIRRVSFRYALPC